MDKTTNSAICNETIFTDFFKKNATALRNYLLYKFGNEQQAEDVVQEAFVKLWQIGRAHV